MDALQYIVREAGEFAKLDLDAHPHLQRHAAGCALASFTSVGREETGNFGANGKQEPILLQVDRLAAVDPTRSLANRGADPESSHWLPQAASGSAPITTNPDRLVFTRKQKIPTANGIRAEPRFCRESLRDIWRG